MPATNVSELIALAKKKPGELTYGTAGVGSAPHMNMVLFESMAGVKLLPVHYRGAAPALTDVIAGHVNLMSVSVSLALPPFRTGQIKLFGIGSTQAARARRRHPDRRRERAAGLRSGDLVRAVRDRGHAARRS